MQNGDKKIIFVTGMFRSGVCLVGDILSMVKNAKNRSIDFDPIIYNLLMSVCKDGSGQTDYPSEEQVKLFSSATVDFLNKTIVDFDENVSIVTDHRLSLLWPLFLRAFPDAYWVIVRRDVDSVVNACLKTNWLSRKNTNEDWCRVYSHFQSCFVGLLLNLAVNKDLYGSKKYFLISPKKIIDGSYDDIYLLCDRFGLFANDIDNKIKNRIWGNKK